jgi:hypothetical protein
VNKFRISRADGRSDAEVVMDVVAANQPGSVIPYEELQQALSFGSSRYFDRTAVSGAINRSVAMIAKRLNRVVRCVRGVGYKVAEAGEHQAVAHMRKSRADTQMRRGLLALEYVDWSAMDENSRKAHEGTLLLLSSMMHAQRSLERRQDQADALIRKLICRKDEASG